MCWLRITNDISFDIAFAKFKRYKSMSKRKNSRGEFDHTEFWASIRQVSRWNDDDQKRESAKLKSTGKWTAELKKKKVSSGRDAKRDQRPTNEVAVCNKTASVCVCPVPFTLGTTLLPLLFCQIYNLSIRVNAQIVCVQWLAVVVVVVTGYHQNWPIIITTSENYY